MRELRHSQSPLLELEVGLVVGWWRQQPADAGEQVVDLEGLEHYTLGCLAGLRGDGIETRDD